MINLDFAAALAAMGAHMSAQEPFEAVCWEWESDLGIYTVDRYAPRRLERELSIHTDDGEGPVDWATSAAAIRACKQHNNLLRAGMSPSRACAEVLAWSLRPAKTPTLRGLAPIVQLLPPKGAFL